MSRARFSFFFRGCCLVWEYLILLRVWRVGGGGIGVQDYFLTSGGVFGVVLWAGGGGGTRRGGFALPF